jgi:death on curing protein
VSIRYIELVDYLAIATEVTGLDVNTLIRVAKIDLAESALHAPAAGFGETEFYPGFIEKASVLAVPREEPFIARWQ